MGVGNIPLIGSVIATTHTFLSGTSSIKDNRTLKRANEIRTMLDPYLQTLKMGNQFQNGEVGVIITGTTTLETRQSKTGPMLLDTYTQVSENTKVTFTFFQNVTTEDGTTQTKPIGFGAFDLPGTWNGFDKQLNANPIGTFMSWMGQQGVVDANVTVSQESFWGNKIAKQSESLE